MQELCRIIPTRVGTSIVTEKDRRSLRDHPHACGDKFGHYFLHFGVQGSSPRVWGQDNDVYSYGARRGIIPTRVGTREEVHKAGFKNAGSSPRVWGQDTVSVLITIKTRIIPTRVGTR